MEQNKKLWEFVKCFEDELSQYFEDDEDLNGGDAVEWLQNRYFEAKELLKMR